jgi:DNA repair exonuclease SbcCD nuclease subunit
MPLRFIHSSDLHLGRRFANIPEPPDGTTRGRLMEARHACIGKLAQAARDLGAAHILLAGDSFDTATPSPQVLRQTLAAMRDHGDVTWWLLPGNHDNLRNGEPIWDMLRADAPPNLRPLLTPDPVALDPDAMLLPCPVPVRNPGRDLTEPMTRTPTPEGALRIGLAHGGIVDFTDDGAQIPPDRDRSAALDYLALGDWHGRIAVTDRTQYSGSPEQDRFRHDRRGVCLAVSIDGPGASPVVAEVETGTFLWASHDLTLQDRQDAAATLDAALPGGARRDTLLRINALGWTSLAGRAAMERVAQQHAPEYAFFDLRTDALGTLHAATDLDDIDRAGAMRMAAETLLAEAEDPDRSAAERDIASAALNRLYSYVLEEAP